MQGTVQHSEPIIYVWRWYYHLPLLAVWAVIGFLIIGLKPNRNWQAWLIFLPLLAAPLFSQMLARLLSMTSADADFLGTLFLSLAIGWSVIWLLDHRLRFLHALCAMLLAGGVYYLGKYGATPDGSLVGWAAMHGMSALILLLAMGLSGHACRGRYNPRGFMVWLLLWSVALPGVGAALLMIPVQLFSWLSGGQGLLQPLVGAVAAGGLWGVVIYLINLPFMLLALNCPFYRERFHDALRRSGTEVSIVALPEVPVALGMPGRLEEAR